MKRIFTTVLLSLGVQAFAQTPAPATSTATAAIPATSTTSASTVSTAAVETKKSPYSLHLDTESYTLRSTTGYINNVNTNLYPFFNYDVPNTDSSLSLYPKFVVTRETPEGNTVYKTHHDYLALKFRQGKLLTQDKNGVDFAADARYYGYFNDRARKDNQADGLFNIRTYLDKKYSDKLSLNGHNRFYFYNTSTVYSNIDTPKRIYDMRLTPTYNLTEKFSAGIMAKYYSINADRNGSDNYYLIPTFNYKLSEQWTASVELETIPFASSDNKFIATSNLLVRPIITGNITPKVWTYLYAEIPTANEKGQFFTASVNKGYFVELDLSITAF